MLNDIDLKPVVVPCRKKPISKSIASNAIARAQSLAEAMLEIMETQLHEKTAPNDQWIRLFGEKDSAVVSLQKLAQVIALLAEQQQAITRDNSLPNGGLSRDEITLLSDWLKEAPAKGN